MRACLLLVALFAASLSPAVADLHDPANSADYLIVTTQELISGYPWIQQLADWRTSHGRTAMVVATDSIWNEFGTGTPSDTVLREFLHYARENWTPPQLRDVFIIGYHDVVPSHVEPDSFQHGGDSIWYDPYFYLSDIFFAALPDSNPPLPQFNIGRLPWSPSQGALPTYLEKVIAYETAIPAEWQSRIHLIADSNFWQSFAEPLAAVVHAGYDIERDYLDFPPGHEWHGDRDEVLSNFQAGSYLVCYNGYHQPGVWSPDRLQLDSSAFATLTNEERLPFIVGMGHDMIQNDFRLNGIMPSALYNPDGGAIGYFGWTIAWASNGTAIKRALFRLATSDSVETLGDIWRMTLEQYIGTRPFYRPPILDPRRQTAQGCVLFGDPGLRLPPRPSAAEDPRAPLPEEIRLVSNYPNPFNASTRIVFELNRAQHVTLRVFDVTGRETATLFDAQAMAGEHDITWDATGFGSGVYFAVLQAGNARQVHKMMLLK
ncbi:T9SS type A sorting domain-containing protein [bacterium]|nr:T9SS type A sorting domain-containing protein [bacterium]MBU1985149.1 T9SS type A sorting domain-containing protein [bacterium]